MTKRFEIGKQYRDTEKMEKDTCILEFVRYTECGDTVFREVTELNHYIKDDNGLIGFWQEPSGFIFEHK